jgi:hypothetical protein
MQPSGLLSFSSSSSTTSWARVSSRLPRSVSLPYSTPQRTCRPNLGAPRPLLLLQAGHKGPTPRTPSLATPPPCGARCRGRPSHLPNPLDNCASSTALQRAYPHLKPWPVACNRASPCRCCSAIAPFCGKPPWPPESSP